VNGTSGLIVHSFFHRCASQLVGRLEIELTTADLYSFADEKAINSAFELGGKAAQYTLIHVVETVGAMVYGGNTDDHETTIDEKLLMEYQEMLVAKGFKVVIQLGFGKPTKAISKIVNEGDFDILVMGTHGHTGFKDLLFGTTVDKVRHEINIPLFLVKN
jgi:manganese transport protein